MDRRGFLGRLFGGAAAIAAGASLASRAAIGIPARGMKHPIHWYMNIQQRAKYYRFAVQNGICSVNEARKMEGLPPIPGMDHIWEPNPV